MTRNLETSDIVLAAMLKVKGQRLDKIEKQGNRGIFCFSDVDETMLNEFDLGKSIVEPVAFNNAIKALTTATRRIT
jgi:predicted secreted acid phosphatase